jgi:hypothetical protein
MKVSLSAGQVNQGYLARRVGKKKEKRQVSTRAPINPSLDTYLAIYIISVAN